MDHVTGDATNGVNRHADAANDAARHADASRHAHDGETELSERPCALVTGASAGLGRAFATRLARDGYDLVLVARDAVALERLAEDLAAAHGCRALALPADLSSSEGIARVADFIDTTRVDVLVNNAGYGLRTSLLDTEPEALAASDSVMLTAVTRLSWHAAHRMRARGRGGILTVSSLAALGVYGVYSAAKSAAMIVTEALAAELADTPVTVTAVLPGFIRTEFHERMRVRRTGPRWIWLEPEQVVDAAVRDARAGRTVSVAGAQYKGAYALLQVLPRPLVRGASGGFRWMRKGAG
ncbi:SDR family NAD(P)-dependent oxidoreductase [Brevibacterium salitolerans]|uniref:SDR family oxidoreductase n=1 Tax=Brevibacterium salitolerans TaxID=1403566 RepID=A0ABP5IA52_9MICO